MAADAIERLHYYQRQYLGAEDFEAQQAYHRDMRRRHNIGHHTWGIVTGLELVEMPREGEPDAVDIYVQPGVAIDGFGREIIVLQPAKLDPADFDAFTNLLYREVWIAFDDELARRPAAGYEVCDATQQFGRLRETFRIVVEPTAPYHDAVMVVGKERQPPPPVPSDKVIIPDDESVPYQELPDDDAEPYWLVRLGSVNWDGTVRKFKPAAVGRLLELRQYVGTVAASVLAPADWLFLERRFPDGKFDDSDFAFVNGRLQVEGRIVAKADVNVHGGKLAFLDSNGQDLGRPLWMQRAGGGGVAGNDLHIRIGEASAKTRLTVGPDAGQVVLAVKGDDTVDVSTGRLSFGRQTRQMIDLWTGVDGKPLYGIGVQSGTAYFRSNEQFCWFKGGEHDDAAGAAGTNGTLQMRLDDQARLHFGATRRQMLNLYTTTYGIGVQSSTLYVRSNADFCWFRGGAHSNARSEPGAGGTLAMKLDQDSSLSVSGGLTTTGNVLVGTNNPGVVKTRHVNGKHWANDNDDDLFLNWRTGRGVVIGEPGGTTSRLEVSGDLIVRGSAASVFWVNTYTLAVKNGGPDSAGTWVVNYAGQFSTVYTVFAVLQGFSLWDNNTHFNNWGHAKSDEAIPQHVFVRVDGFDNSAAHGSTFCSEVSSAADNTILVTVVVLGRKSV